MHDDLDFVHLQAARFFMGANDGAPSESPMHQRELHAFELMRNPVTNHQFARFVTATGYRTTAEIDGSAFTYDGTSHSQVSGVSWRAYASDARKEHPVVLVSWIDAAAFSAWAGARLPSEAEWELAAQLTSIKSTRIPPSRAWNGTPPTFPAMAAVDELPCHMVGNVWQWCDDWYDEQSYRDTRSPDTGTLKCRRGGAWNVAEDFRLRPSNRGAYLPHSSSTNIGFRCAR